MHTCADTAPHVHLSHAWSWAGRQRHPQVARLGVGFLGLLASPVLAADLARLGVRRAAACCRSSARQDEGAPVSARGLAQRSVERMPTTRIDEPAAVHAQPSPEHKGTLQAQPTEQKRGAAPRLQVPALEAFKAYRRRLFEAREAADRHRATVDAALALHMPVAERHAALEALDDAVHALHGRRPRKLGFDDVRRKIPEPLRSHAAWADPGTGKAVMAFVRARLAAVDARDRALQVTKGLRHAQALKDSLDAPGLSVR